MPSSLRSPQQHKLREVLVDARKNARLTQAELADCIKKPQSFVAKYELGERRIDVVEFVTVAKALGIAPGDLLGNYMKACEEDGI